MDTGPPFPFAELYGSAQAARGAPRVVPGVALSAWKADARALRCGLCLKKFSLLRWKHHCRVCGDVCCRRCLGFCLVDVPLLGVDLAFSCARCIRRVAAKAPQPPARADADADAEASAASCMTIMSSPLSSSSLSSASSVDQLVAPPASSAAAAFAPALQPRGTSAAAAVRAAVTVSQARSTKLQSVCALVSDYLECAGAAVVLLSGDRHVWVVAHRGLRGQLLHGAAFLALCRRAAAENASFALSEPRGRAAGDAFQFAAAAPLRRRPTSDGDEEDEDEDEDEDAEEDAPAGEALGCLLALGTRARSDAGASRVRKTLENLARLVMDLLTEERTILRLFESGDFKMFAANATDLAPATASVFQQCGVPDRTDRSGRSDERAASSTGRTRPTPSPRAGGFLSSVVIGRLRRSRSFSCGDCQVAATAASPAPSAPSATEAAGARRADRTAVESDGFDIVAHPGMNRGRKHAATTIGADPRPPAGPHAQRHRPEVAPTSSSAASSSAA